MNEILALAVHDLNRREGRFEVNLEQRLLPVTVTTQRVIDEIYDLYNRRASKPMDASPPTRTTRRWVRFATTSRTTAVTSYG